MGGENSPLKALPLAGVEEAPGRGAEPGAALPPPASSASPAVFSAPRPRPAAPAGAAVEGSVHLSLKCKIVVAAVWGEESASPLTCAAAL